MRGSHVGPGTFGCGRLGMLFMAFRFLQRRTRGKKKKKKHHGNNNQHHGEAAQQRTFVGILRRRSDRWRTYTHQIHTSLDRRPRANRSAHAGVGVMLR